MRPSTDAPVPAQELLARLLDGIEGELERAVALRHRLHEAPELAHAESRTAASVAGELPVAAATATGGSLIAKVGAGDHACVAVRAELDGLPIEERTGAPFSARGGAMHACGHDVHMAALVALARAASALGDALSSPLLAVFQASEEAYPSGAEQLAHAELAASAPGAIVAAHVHPELPWGAVALDPGAVNASSDSVEITIEGAPTHAAYPHRGRDPVLAIAHVVLALHAQAARRIDPLGAAVLSVGVLEAASAENVIPARARARAALRAHSEADRLVLRELAAEVAHGIAAAHGCRASVELVPGEPVLENDADIVAAARELLGAGGFHLAGPWRSCGSDDFAFFGELAPLAMGFVGLDGAAGFERRPLHHPELLPPDDAVGAVARAQAVLYVAAVRRLAAVPARTG